MNVSKNIILTIVSFLAVTAGIGPSAHSASSGPIMLEIVDGETAFLVDKPGNKAWWIVGECRRSIPMEVSGKSSKLQNKSITSKMISEDVRIGSRPVKLQQQFRFNLATQPASIDVYNSVRGGWSSVPVEVNMTCTADAACRRRAELPEC